MTYNLKQTNFDRMTYNLKRREYIRNYLSFWIVSQKKNIYGSTVMLLGSVILNFKISPFMQVLLIIYLILG